MPNADGKLTDQEQKLANKWITEHWKSWTCPFSGGTTWDLGQYVAQSTIFSGGALIVGGPVYPYITVTCKDCGYVVFLNAIKIGIIPPSTKPANPTETRVEPAEVEEGENVKQPS